MNKLILYSSLFHSYTQVAKKKIDTNYTVFLEKSNTSATITKEVLFTKLLIEGRRGSRIMGNLDLIVYLKFLFYS